MNLVHFHNIIAILSNQGERLTEKMLIDSGHGCGPQSLRAPPSRGEGEPKQERGLRKKR